MKVQRVQAGLVLRYRWQNVHAAFNMPLKLKSALPEKYAINGSRILRTLLAHAQGRAQDPYANQPFNHIQPNPEHGTSAGEQRAKDRSDTHF